MLGMSGGFIKGDSHRHTTAAVKGFEIHRSHVNRISSEAYSLEVPRGLTAHLSWGGGAACPLYNSYLLDDVPVTGFSPRLGLLLSCDIHQGVYDLAFVIDSAPLLGKT